ncbi:MAG TPA: bi-domain-containing oxidoreductase [Terriglobales bacterium]|nr:bi-domain-containing oxidoreductase [Terriglobales bacterium]
MKQLLQDARSGELTVTEVPVPQLLPGCVLVRTAVSLVSAGTERASAEFARKGLVAKAKARPDLVRDVVAKIQRDGVAATVGTVRSRLAQPQAIGYSSAGKVVATGDGVSDIQVGDRVACAGAGYAVHGEYACIPRLLAAKIPEGASVRFDDAAFATVGAVCLHGIRTAEIALGETVAVIGLGLLGQITVQLLKVAGCRVLGMDPVESRASLANQNGADGASTSDRDFRDLCFQKTGGIGVDAVLITAETAMSGPVNLAAEVARDRATVVAVGTVGMELERKLYYEKELTFKISRSYGPGRYDAAYEQKGLDYPIGHVRWTETRNMQAFLQFIADRRLDLESLVTHRFPVDDARRAYDLILGRSHEPFLGVLLTYASEEFGRELKTPRGIQNIEAWRPKAPEHGDVGLGVLGAGAFAQNILLPALKIVPGLSFKGVCNASGARSRSAAERFNFAYCAETEDELLRDPGVNAVLIATRHHLHAEQVLAALGEHKAVFCEKPLCLTESELGSIVRSMTPETRERANAPLLMVGFNRRFAPMAQELKKFFAQTREPLSMNYRVNAGYIPADHWVNDPEVGGGRILGEVCHFVDFLSFVAGGSPIEVRAEGVGNPGQYSLDNIVATLKFANGGVGTITYMANGDKSSSKERLEIFGGGSVAILEDFRRLELVRNGRKTISRARWKQDKGHQAEMRAFAEAVRGKIPPPIPFEEIVGSTLATLRLKNACQTGEALRVDVGEFIALAPGGSDDAMDTRAAKQSASC